jgi:hypothetical protein
MARKTKRTRSTKRSRGPTKRRGRLFPSGYEEAVNQLRKPELEIVFRMPKGSSKLSGPELQARMAPTLTRFKKRIDLLSRRLRRQLEALPCLQVLSVLAVTTIFHDPETYRESDSHHSAIRVEYPAWLYMTASKRPQMTARVLDSAAMQKVFDLVDDIAAATQSYYTIQGHIAAAAPATAEEDVLIRARNWNLFVRSPSYEHHHRAQLEHLFRPFSTELREVLAFAVDDAIAVEDALTNLVNERINEINKKMVETINEWKEKLHADSVAIEPEEQDLLTRFRQSGDPSQAATVAALTWAQTFWYTGFMVTPDEVAKESGLEVGVVGRILGRFSTSFGQARRADDWPSVEDHLERAPLIDLGDGTWWVGLIFKLGWAIPVTLEAGLVQTRHWERYQKHRSRWLEDRAVALIAGADVHVERWVNLRYDKDDELDGLVLCGGTAVLVETKAGRMSLAGRRGAPSGIRSDLRDLLTDTQHQLNRATDYLLSQDEAVFRTDAGPVKVRRAEINRMVHVIVTPDSLTAFVTRLPRLALAGVFDRRSLPWAVDINDLLICTEILGSPARLIHYIDRRMRAARLGVEAPEELDFLGHYLTRGLYFDDIDDDVNLVYLTSHAEAFDDFYRHESGTRKTPAPMPTRSIHPVIDELVRQLETVAPPNFAEAVFWLLELGSDGQATMAEMIEARRKRARDGLLTAVRTFMGTTVFAYIATPDDDLRPLVNYLTAVKYAGQSHLAIGIAQSVLDPSKVAVEVQYARWAEDPETERWSAEILRLFESRAFTPSSPDAIAP